MKNKTDNTDLFLVICILAGIIFALAMIIWVNTGFANEDNDYLQQSYIDPRKQVIYGNSNKSDGYLQRSKIDPRRIVQYDKDGKERGYWQESYIDPRKTIFHKK